VGHQHFLLTHSVSRPLFILSFFPQAAIKQVKEEASEEEWAQVLVAVPTGATVQKLNIEYGKPLRHDWSACWSDGTSSRGGFARCCWVL